MPGFDGSGPRGQGAMTGGGRGYCAVNLGGSYAVPGAGRRFLMSRGAGRGCRNWFYATGLPGWIRGRGVPVNTLAAGNTVSKDDELQLLKNQEGFLKEELEAISSRIHELENKEKGS